MHQVFIMSEPIVNESRRDADLLIEHPMPPMTKLLQQSIGKPKPKRKPRKRHCIENKAEYDDFVNGETLNKNLIVKQPGMRAEGTQNPLLVWRPRTNLGRILGKNLLDKLVRPA